VSDTMTRTVSIEENTVASLGTEDFAAANSFEANFTLPDGSTVHGPSMLLVRLSDDTKQRVGVGSQIEVEGRCWTVSSIQLGEVGDGEVSLQAMVPADRSPADRADLDFLFRSACQRCGGRTGWDGSTSVASGRMVIGMRCIRCPEAESMTGGRIERMFFEGSPAFTPGRSV